MSIYQRYLSKSLIFFSGICIIFLLCIESNIGFKLIFNFTNQFFIGLKIEEVSGNWRDFTLNNIRYNTSEFFVKADSIHITLDIQSLFQKSTVCKEIETKNLIVLLKKNRSSYPFTKDASSNIIKKNIFIKYSIIFKKIHIDKILLKTSNINVFLSNVYSGINLINNTVTFSPTYVDTMHVVSLTDSNIKLKKSFKKNTLEAINGIFDIEKINSFLHFLSTQSKIFIPLNINLTFLKCKNLNFSNNNIDTFLSLELQVQVIKNILNIKKIKINSNLLNIQSYGKIIFNSNSIIFNIENKILMPNFYKKTIDISFKASLKNQFIFQLKFNNFYKINIHGLMLLQNLNHSFFLHLNSNNLSFFIKKKLILKLKNFNITLMGKKNHYSLSLKNILSIKGMPSIFIKINGHGDLKNIFLKKIRYFILKKSFFHKKIIPLKSVLEYHQSISQLIGKIHLSGKSSNNIYNLCASKIHLDGNIMQKNFSILGSLCYKNFNVLKIPRLDIFAGKNKLYLKGLLGKRINIYSSVYANNLDYFLPNLQGKVKSKLNLYGNYRLPMMTNKILARNLNWNNIHLNSLRMFSNINIKNALPGKVLLDVKKLQLDKFYINFLRIKANWNNKKQNFCFLLNSPDLYVNVALKSMIDNKTGDWHGSFKKINIRTFLGELITQKSPRFYYNKNKNINNIYEKKEKLKNTFLYKIKKSLFNILKHHHIDFKSKLSVQAKLKWILGKDLYHVKMFLKSKNVKLSKVTKEAVFYEDVDDIKIFLNFRNNNLKSKWTVTKYITSLEKNISGYLNILDIYNQKNIEGNSIISNFPISLINFFTTNFKQVDGVFDGKIKFFGTLYRPKVSADVNLKNIFIKSDNILKYITLFFPYFIGKTEHIKINQEIMIKNANILFRLNTFLNNKNPEWNVSFYSKKIVIEIFPKIKVKFSSQLELHYLLNKYDILGYIRCALFFFKIDEKDFIF
ncbi:translocation/assembly module TamB [Buchnera aphidicola]|uniref:translocation/assembly module TamB n=1 Tax=Buchnera aphidicola TaxID=9 RepID=UPI003464E489